MPEMDVQSMATTIFKKEKSKKICKESLKQSPLNLFIRKGFIRGTQNEYKSPETYKLQERHRFLKATEN